jgi:biotin-dependent carboxylase-like uncharacterized protein
MPLRVLDPGLYTLLVDFGRPSSRSLGVPAGGAADRAALALGNALVGNAPGAPALEITLVGPTLQTDTELAGVVYGAPFSVKGSHHTGPAGLRAGRTFTLLPGEELEIGGTATGARAYFCVRGGIAAPVVLGSRTALGPLCPGQELQCPAGRMAVRSMNHPSTPAQEPETLRVIPGSQADWFRLEVFYEGIFTITPASDRMGLRLQGEPLVPAGSGPREMISEPVCPGAVQVTRDGQCIVLGVDGQTIGGYPKVAHVISADLDRLGQLRPGRRVRFAAVPLEEAAALYRRRQAELHAWVTRLRAALGS